MKKIKSFFLGIKELIGYIADMWTVMKARSESEKRVEEYEKSYRSGKA